ncbi:Sterol uptake control protein 2 [Pleurostoma richardsiae]|uniref:Sterol uptake control protein 2 n=1 Tax=Pleurostoma richardsiae TaxID=41990 RepID=A0AA38VUE1_9PEZI|nr:Sterol uptake control protein 2 [Pleurostoma richardsiae]
MHRRSHKKSRRGCLECKRRHIKCDESRPVCLNCSTAERVCSYPGDTSTPRLHTPHSATSSPSLSPASNPALAELANGTFARQDITIGEPVDPPNVNFLHLELWNHFITESYNFVPTNSPLVKQTKELMIKYAFECPYLMYQVLAIAARHLCIVKPDHSAFYRHQAIQLQTHALTLFNSLDPDAAASNRAPILLFSSTLSFHSLCDALSTRESDSDIFLDRFMAYVHLHRGVQKVVGGSWNQIIESDLGPIILASSGISQATGIGHECDELRVRIGASGLDEESLQACEKAIGFIQWALDGADNATERRARAILSWPPLLSERFVELLEERRPEAVATLAYYAVLLHHCRDLWLVGDSGNYVVRLVAERLGPQWAGSMRWPLHALEEKPEPQP